MAEGGKGKLDTLREKPKDQKTAIAGGVAITIVAVLLFAWGIWFIRKITNEKPTINVYDVDFSYIRNEIGDAMNTGSSGASGNVFFDSAEDYRLRDQSYDSF